MNSGGPNAAREGQDALTGRMIAGKFLVGERVGQGAMGVVYRARHIGLDKTVAFKVMRPENAFAPSFAGRFEREARAASRLDHPNSIRILDFGVEPDGLLYLAMEFVNGRDLAKLIVEMGPLEPSRIIRIMSQTLAAVAVAHDMGVLHRDLKPENIMLTQGVDDEGAQRDIVKVCDFGIAKLIDGRATDGRSDPMDPYLTLGIVIGTPTYMSPEQARGENVDARSDLYSIGVVMYEMLVGRPPFMADTPLAVIVKHVSEEPLAPSLVHPGVDAALEAICLRCMRKDPNERYSDARQLRAALRAAAATSAPGVRFDSDGVNTLASGPPPRIFRFDTPASAKSEERPALKRRTDRTGLLAAAALAAFGAMALLRARSTATPLAHRDSREERQEVVPTASQPPPLSSQSGPAASAPEASSKIALGVPALQPTPDARPRPAAASVPRDHVASPHGRPSVAFAAAASTQKPVGPEDSEGAMPAAEPATEAAMLATASAPSSPSPTASFPSLAPQPLPSARTAPVAPYDLGSARVDVGPADSVDGCTVSSVNRAVAGAGSQLTACYRAALPRMTGAVEGRAILHLETDGSGVVIEATLNGPFNAYVGSCVASALRARRIANVDTGSARADLPLTFTSH